jgi:hypothetical protein
MTERCASCCIVVVFVDDCEHCPSIGVFIIQVLVNTLFTYSLESMYRVGLGENVVCSSFDTSYHKSI